MKEIKIEIIVTKPNYESIKDLKEAIIRMTEQKDRKGGDLSCLH